jgi:DMSO reductase anchor subunit/ferredoxin
MTGCPVDAYSKDGLTGIVLHSADACIGCQYCTWNCSYGVPQYNPERGVVGKCDMCYGRLMDGDQPACSNACPENAIQIEVVRIDEWRNDYVADANSPGMPSADHSISTTRITQPVSLPRTVQRVNLSRIQVEAAHWPLVFMTVLTQLSVGAFSAMWSTGSASRNRSGAFIALAIAAIALAASTLHLGRPIHALRALRMWRRSWLSREVLLFTLFALVATAYSAAVFFGTVGATALGFVTTLTGISGIGASARLYMVPGRPAWNTLFTPAEFLLTTFLLGSLSSCLFGGSLQHSTLPFASLATFLLCSAKLLWLSRAEEHELQATLRLLSTVLAIRLLVRFALLGLGLILLYNSSGRFSALVAAACIVSSEFVGRLLFFLSVVPTNIAAEYLAVEAAA